MAIAQSLPPSSVSSMPITTPYSIDTTGSTGSIDSIDTRDIIGNNGSIDTIGTIGSIDSMDTTGSIASIDAIVDSIDTSATPSSQSQTKNQNIPHIRGIEIYGNVTTRPEVLRYYFAFDTGEVLDTSKLRLTRAGLLSTQLYEKVDIFPHIREDGAHIFIIMKESVRLDLGYGVEYSTRKYGESNLWYSVNVDAAINNFRGRMETLWFGISAVERLGLDLSWHKPFLPTPYYITLSGGVSDYPDDALPLDYADVYGKLAVGRKVWARSRVFVSAMHTYRHRSILGSDAMDTLSSGANHSGLSVIAFPDKNNFSELFAGVGFATDRRSARFDPKSGWLLNTQLGTNHLYSGVITPFFQATSELRYYAPLFTNDVAAFRLLLTLRDTDAGSYHRLSYGGAGEIRGYANKALGWNFPAQSSILASVKYHRPLYDTQELPVPLLSAIFTDIRNLTFRVDATLIADAAMLYGKPLGALTQRGDTQPGLAFGFGTRILAPRIRQSGCIDLVFGRTETENGYLWEPALHLYLDLFY